MPCLGAIADCTMYATWSTTHMPCLGASVDYACCIPHTCHVLVLVSTVPCTLRGPLHTCHVLVLLLTVPCTLRGPLHTCHVLVLLLTVPCTLRGPLHTCHVLVLVWTMPVVYHTHAMSWCYCRPYPFLQGKGYLQMNKRTEAN